MTFGSKTFARAVGEAFDGDQLEGICDGCDMPHSRCACDPELPVCACCDGPLDKQGFCASCEEHTKLEPTDDNIYRGWYAAEVAALRRDEK